MKRTMFYVMSLTWGLPMTLCGAIAAIALIATGHKPKKWGWSWYFEVGNGGDGFTMGPFFFVGPKASEHTKSHEFGHGIQNTQLGPMMLLVTLMSIARYWYREFKHYAFKIRYADMKPYDSAWWEEDATRLGTEMIEKLNEDN